MNLDAIVARLAESQPRATYGAVAGVLGVAPNGLMNGRPHSQPDSWVVAAVDDNRSGSRRGWPTRYSDADIDPACFAQCQAGAAGVIADAEQIGQWLA